MKSLRKRPRYKSSAEQCRMRRFKVGDCIAGYRGDTVVPTIKITAIGREEILAVMVHHDGTRIRSERERMWTLDLYDWEKIKSAPVK